MKSASVEMAEEALYLVLSGLLRASLAPGTPSSSRGVQKPIVRVPQSTSALTDLGGEQSLLSINEKLRPVGCGPWQGSQRWQ